MQKSTALIYSETAEPLLRDHFGTVLRRRGGNAQDDCIAPVEAMVLLHSHAASIQRWDICQCVIDSTRMTGQRAAPGPCTGCGLDVPLTREGRGTH